MLAPAEHCRFWGDIWLLSFKSTTGIFWSLAFHCQCNSAQYLVALRLMLLVSLCSLALPDLSVHNPNSQRVGPFMSNYFSSSSPECEISVLGGSTSWIFKPLLVSVQTLFCCLWGRYLIWPGKKLWGRILHKSNSWVLKQKLGFRLVFF